MAPWRSPVELRDRVPWAWHGSRITSGDFRCELAAERRDWRQVRPRATPGPAHWRNDRGGARRCPQCGAHWRSPGAYLKADTRGATAAFAHIDARSELARLEADLACGRWAERERHLVNLDAIEIGHRLICCEIRTEGESGQEAARSSRRKQDEPGALKSAGVTSYRFSSAKSGVRDSCRTQPQAPIDVVINSRRQRPHESHQPASGHRPGAGSPCLAPPSAGHPAHRE